MKENGVIYLWIISLYQQENTGLQTFDMVVGQESITNTLKNAIKNKLLAQAYLFCGPRGVGKTTCARIFAKTINCSNLKDTGEACDECESCKSFNTLRSCQYS